MARKQNGICCICGAETELTFEHIPPKAAFNKYNLKLYDIFGSLIYNNMKYKAAQRGAGCYSLCKTCNNKTGEWYGAAYAEFAKQGIAYVTNGAKGGLSVPYTIFPLRVIKQVISCFASVNGPNWCKTDPQIKQFLLDPAERNLPKELDIRMYLQSEERVKQQSIHGTMNARTGERFYGAEWAYPPFSFILICDSSYTNYRVLNELVSLRPFLNYNYEDKTSVYLKIPLKPCNPITLDFRENLPSIESIRKNQKARK